MPTIRVYPIRKKPPKVQQPVWYLVPYLYSNIGRDDIIDYAVQNSQIPRSYIAIAFDALVTEVRNFVMNGHSVKLDGVGIISPTIAASGASAPALVTADMIRRVNFRFRPDVQLKRIMRRVKPAIFNVPSSVVVP